MPELTNKQYRRQREIVVEHRVSLCTKREELIKGLTTDGDFPVTQPAEDEALFEVVKIYHGILLMDEILEHIDLDIDETK